MAFPCKNHSRRGLWGRECVKMYNFLLWRMRISQNFEFFCWTVSIFFLAPFLFVFLCFLLLSIFILCTSSTGLKSFDLNKWKTLERKPWSSTGILACFSTNFSIRDGPLLFYFFWRGDGLKIFKKNVCRGWKDKINKIVCKNNMYNKK